jgi:hypothetical protein
VNEVKVSDDFAAGPFKACQVTSPSWLGSIGQVDPTGSDFIP